MHILIAGCGYVGERLAGLLLTSGHAVTGLRRTPPERNSGPEWIAADLGNLHPISLARPVDAVVLAAGLRRDTDDQYRRLLVKGYGDLLESLRRENHPVQRVIMVSTTGVLAEEQGGWVDESSPVSDDRTPGRFYLEAERMVSACGWPATVARLSGIFGPGRIRLIREVREHRARLHPPPVHYLNHIHADDAAGALAHLVTLPAAENLYLVTDTEPADRNEVLAWIAERLGAPRPPEAEAGEGAPARRSGNKRCRSTRLVNSGYQFRHPTYREGYEALLPESA